MTDLSDEAKAEIAAAAGIVRKDFSRATMASVLEEFGLVRKPKEDPPNPQDPPVKDPKEDPPTPKKAGLWWGSESE